MDFIVGLVIAFTICFAIQCNKIQKIKFENEILGLRIEEIKRNFEIYRNVSESEIQRLKENR